MNSKCSAYREIDPDVHPSIQTSAVLSIISNVILIKIVIKVSIWHESNKNRTVTIISIIKYSENMSLSI
jgi:hypothetical protein